MELREPPQARPTRASAPNGVPTFVKLLLGLNLVGILALGGLLLTTQRGDGDDGERLREIAGKLQAAGALGEAASLYESYLATARPDDSEASKVAFSLGKSYLEQGRYATALRWLYEAEARDSGELGDEIRRQIVLGLDRLGNPFGAQAALEASVRLEPDGGAVRRAAGADPVVATIGSREIRRSEIEAGLADLPPELAASARQPEAQARLVQRFVAEELLWNKARKLGYDRDPAVLRQTEAAARQLAVGRLVEEEILGKIDVAASDVRLFFEANKERYRGEDGSEPSFEGLQGRVEAEYRQSKAQAAYEELVNRELAAASVELFPERMRDGT